MPTATNGGVQLHWDEQGSGHPVLLIMGHLLPGRMWYPVLPALSTRHRVVWFDNRGTGDSDSTDTATVSDLAADARAVMDAAGIDQAHVYGVSMGGGVALQLAYESPNRVSSLVLGCTALRSPTFDEKEMPGPFLGSLRYRVPVRLLSPLLKKSLYGPQAPAQAVRRDLAELAKSTWSPRGVYAQDLAIQTYDMTPDKVATLLMPALILHGTADRAVPYRHAVELLDTLPDARLITYDGAGHHVIVDNTAQANEDVLRFLAELGS